MSFRHPSRKVVINLCHHSRSVVINFRHPGRSVTFYFRHPDRSAAESRDLNQPSTTLLVPRLYDEIPALVRISALGRDDEVKKNPGALQNQSEILYNIHMIQGSDHVKY